MPNYSIERKGSDFVVKAGQEAILRFATRRLALAMVREAKAARQAAPLPAAGNESAMVDV